MSRDYVGDLAETVALLWPKAEDQPPEVDDGSLTLSAIIDRLHATSRAAAPAILARMMDHLDASGRFALLKLATGGLRVGISARLAKRSEEHTSELQSLMRSSYAVFCLKKKKNISESSNRRFRRVRDTLVDITQYVATIKLTS